MMRDQARGRGAAGKTSTATTARAAARAKSSPAAPAMVSVNTGSRRARALQQLAAKRTRKGGTAAGNTGKNGAVAITTGDNARVKRGTPQSISRKARGTSGRRRVSLGATPVPSSSAGRAHTTAATATTLCTSRVDAATPRNVRLDGNSGTNTVAAVTPAINACAARPSTTTSTTCVRISLPLPSSGTSASAGGAVGRLGMRIVTRTDRTGRAVSTSAETATGSSALELEPVRLVPLHTGEGGGALMVKERRHAPLPFLLGNNGENIDPSLEEVESICEEIWDRGDRCTVVQEVEEDGGSLRVDDDDDDAIPLSLTTVNVLLMGMDAAILLRRCGDGIYNGRYCLYRPTSVSDGELFVVPEDAGTADVANNDEEEKISADGMDTTADAAATTMSEGDDDQPRMEVLKQVEEGENMIVTETSSKEAPTECDDGARPIQ